MRCRDLMKSEVESFREHDTVDTIARRMRDLEFGFAPICDPDGRPVGTLTDRDLAIRVCADDLQAGSTCASEVMTRDVVACRESEEIEAAEELMARHQVARVMVLNEAGHLVGVISLSDIIDEEDDRRAVETLRLVVDREVRG